MGLNTYKIEVGFNLQENNKHYRKAVNIPSGFSQCHLVAKDIRLLR